MSPFLLAVAWAAPSARNQRFCVDVNVDFNDGAGGDRWTSPYGANEKKPARGFAYELWQHGDGGYTYAGHLFEAGANAGCTPLLSVMYDAADPDAYEYFLRVSSAGAEVSGNVVNAFDQELQDVSDPGDDFFVALETDAVTFHRAVTPGATIPAETTRNDGTCSRSQHLRYQCMTAV